LVHEDTFWCIFSSKKFRQKSWPKIYLGQDPDPVKKSSGSATLATASHGDNQLQAAAEVAETIALYSSCITANS
jgi:hypothetical protein